MVVAIVAASSLDLADDSSGFMLFGPVIQRGYGLRSDLFPPHPGLQRALQMRVDRLVARVPQDEAVVLVEQDEALGDAVDALAEPLVGGAQAPPLPGDEHGEGGDSDRHAAADEVIMRRGALDL